MGIGMEVANSVMLLSYFTQVESENGWGEGLPDAGLSGLASAIPAPVSRPPKMPLSIE